MGIIKSIPGYYTLLDGMIRAEHGKTKTYEVIDVEIVTTKRFEHVDALVRSVSESSISYKIYSSDYDYKSKKEFCPTSHFIPAAILSAGANDIENRHKKAPLCLAQ